ncbi:ribulose-phosphate 3-epimerase [Rubrivirga sp. S365]|uniref:Ribulose-phosphate 3-epimerase n=1 Tax=Rubrivirga litoralis TaxID=3075598 RepID=A0ABU3BM36_9BACT|nr:MULTISPECIES: ribulose-phosphate 3-epimerase [unclassified Rubrivirga]MDT0630356.1 ribulose-phosphate 3-epimerase [Rubrivirga sp. F394]MDT7855867.1 ribulose-phosphate 3-epimerase [Rubrivirga sp. S365]
MTLAPSVLAADFGRLEAHAREAIDAGADWLHIDVMDGHFVPNISFGVPVMRGLRALADETDTPFDVHLMIEEPDRYLEDFAEAGASVITVHQEACPHLHRTVQAIHALGCRAGVAVNPATPLVMLEDVLGDLDLVLVMSVNPGFGGQSFIPGSTDKVRRLRQMTSGAQTAGAGRPLIEVDGGVSPDNARALLDAGADVFVAGSAVFRGDVAENVAAFRRAEMRTA